MLLPLPASRLAFPAQPARPGTASTAVPAPANLRKSRRLILGIVDPPLSECAPDRRGVSVAGMAGPESGVGIPLPIDGMEGQNVRAKFRGPATGEVVGGVDRPALRAGLAVEAADRCALLAQLGLGLPILAHAGPFALDFARGPAAGGPQWDLTPRWRHREALTWKLPHEPAESRSQTSRAPRAA